MAPFLSPKVVVSGFKERAEALAVQGMFNAWHIEQPESAFLTAIRRRQVVCWDLCGQLVCVRCKWRTKSVHSVFVFAVVDTCPADDEKHEAELIETKKALSRRSIEELAYVPDISSLAVLTGRQSVPLLMRESLTSHRYPCNIIPNTQFRSANTAPEDKGCLVLRPVYLCRTSASRRFPCSVGYTVREGKDCSSRSDPPCGWL